MSRNNSDMLFGVRRWILFAIFLSAAGAGALLAQQTQTPPQPNQQAPSQLPQAQQAPTPPTGQPQQQAPGAPAAPSGQAPQRAAPPQAPPAPAHYGPVIVLDPAHGGTDPGARGAGATVEKDLVLNFARVARGELERQGFHVVLTRNDDSNPSYDDRAAIANVHRDTIFITLHVASTGAFGTARAYYNQFAEPLPLAQAASASASATNVLPWFEAQRPYLEVSHRLADILQGELAQRFAGSPSTAAAVGVRELRSIAAPAVAVEISSVVTADPDSLAQRAGPLAAAIAHSVQLYRPSGSAAGGK